MEKDEVRGEGMMTAKNNQIPGWKYYNHAAIPTCAPHEVPDLTPVKDGSVWHIEGKKPLLVRYTTEWDCGYDTGWWYLIREAPFNIDELSKNSRKHIKEAFRKVRVEKIDPMLYIDDLYECYHQAFLKYKRANNENSYEFFKYECSLDALNNVEYWAGFDIVSGTLIGWLNVRNYGIWSEIITAKFNPQYLSLRVSDALYAFVLDYYLNIQKKKYVSSGSRSIQHNTNTQEYKESHFGYRKAYCKMQILYSKKLQLVVNVLYPLRNIIEKMGQHVKKIHLLTGLLKMEEVRRIDKDGKK